MTSAILGHSAVFGRGDAASPEVYTDVGEVVSISGPSLSLDILDVTNLASTNNTKEFIPGLIDPGEITIECNSIFSSTQQQGLRTDMTGRTLRNFRITWPTSPNYTATFAGYVTGWSVPTTTSTDKVSLSVTVKVTGSITFA